MSAVLVGKFNFQDYLVLGDDVVIACKEVALIYRRVIESLGVGISDHKRILPSESVGLEFASKLINCEGNLSPLPILLLTKEGIVSKLTFLSDVVRRLVADGVRETPSLDVLLRGVFGPRLGRELGGL
jgi:hypothetical protein